MHRVSCWLKEPDESLASCVNRELREETGYALRAEADLEGAPTLEPLPQAGYSSTGLTDETVHVVFAQVEHVADANRNPTNSSNLPAAYRRRPPLLAETQPPSAPVPNSSSKPSPADGKVNVAGLRAFMRTKLRNYTFLRVEHTPQLHVFRGRAASLNCTFSRVLTEI